MKCQVKGHRFQKFDEESLFCERCGERRVITTRAWWGVIPPYPTWQPYWERPYWYYPTITTGGTTTVRPSGVIDVNTIAATYPEGTSVTYTADGSNADA